MHSGDDGTAVPRVGMAGRNSMVRKICGNGGITSTVAGPRQSGSLASRPAQAKRVDEYDANNPATVCYHFATQLLNTGREWLVRSRTWSAQKPNKQGLIETVRYENGRLLAHFECGAFNHSATSPGAMMGQARAPWSGRVLGEDGWPDKALNASIRASGDCTRSQNGWDRQTRKKPAVPCRLN